MGAKARNKWAARARRYLKARFAKDTETADRIYEQYQGRRDTARES